MSASVLQLPQPPRREPSPAPEPPETGLWSRLLMGLLVVVILVFGAGGWAATATLSGAVIASGLIVVESNVKKVQHPSGGVVGQILVKNGDRVAAGDVVVKLDDTQTRAALGIVVSQLIELTGRAARLAAERDDATEVAFPASLWRLGAEAQRVAEGERRLFEAKRKTTDGQKAQLGQRIEQFKLEIEGLTAQRNAKARELKLVREELARVTDMFQRHLTPITRVLAMEREETRIDGEHGALVAQIARAGGQISEVGLQILSIEQNSRTEAQRDLRESEGRIAELMERKVAAEDQLRRVDLKAPIDGMVHELGVHTVGGVITAGEPVLLIVPSGDLLTIEVRVSPADIDQVAIGQKAVLRFPAFSQRTTPELSGRVVRIAADLSREPQTGQTFFVVRLKADEGSGAQFDSLRLVPGMPVEAFIETGQRTALSYLMKPLTDQFARAFREE